MAIEESIINQARNTDLASYLINKGIALTKQGKGMALVEHDSLSITGNLWFWRSRRIGGNTLDYLQKVEGMTFKQAIEELTGEKGGQIVPYVPIPHEPKALVMPDKADNIKRLYAYLTKTRGISPKVLDICLKRHLLYQDTHGNAVFRMRDIAGKVVGAEIVGTSQQHRFKGIATGSRLGYGFNISFGAEPQKLLLFESAIDLLSYITLYGNKLTSHVLISMAGLKEVTAVNMASLYGIAMNNVYCCVDRDEAGINFCDNMQSKHGTKRHLPPVTLNIKDWNEILTRYG
jgi:hypothetical protein